MFSRPRLPVIHKQTSCLGRRLGSVVLRFDLANVTRTQHIRMRTCVMRSQESGRKARQKRGGLAIIINIEAAYLGLQASFAGFASTEPLNPQKATRSLHQQHGCKGKKCRNGLQPYGNTLRILVCHAVPSRLVGSHVLFASCASSSVAS